VRECELPIAAAAAIATGEKHSRGHAVLVPLFAKQSTGALTGRPLPSQAFAFAIACLRY
jgi:hypothetical protein